LHIHYCGDVITKQLSSNRATAWQQPNCCLATIGGGGGGGGGGGEYTDSKVIAKAYFIFSLFLIRKVG
jgi:hypothetical protein